MIWFVCLVAALVPCSLAERPELQVPTCPLDSDRNNVNATIPDPDVCSWYYHCVNGYAWPRQCPPRTHFNPVATGRNCTYRMCTYAFESGCTDSIYAEEKIKMLEPYFEKYGTVQLPDEKVPETGDIKEIVPDTGDIKEDNKAVDYPCFQDDDGNWVDLTLPARKNCNQYYDCVAGISFVNECPPTMFYTPILAAGGPLEECQIQACVSTAEDARCAIDGGWGEWGSWSSCSVACGDGFRTRERPCDDPLPQNGGDDCEGRGLDAILCNEGECVENSTVVFVARLTDLATGQTVNDPVEFERVLINTDNAFDPVTNSFEAPSDANYFMALNSGSLALRQVDMYLSGDARAIGNRRSHGNHAGRDALSTNTILTLSAGDNMTVAAGADTALSADAGKPTSWAIFNVNDIGSTTALFSYGYDSSETNPTNPLQFNVNVSDVGGDYDSSTGLFRPSLPGIWFLTYSAGVDSTTTLTEVDFTMSCSGCNAQTFMSSKLRRSHTDYQGIDTLSRSVIVDLPVNSQITITSANAYYSSAGLQTSFSGFYYQPDTASDRIAWFVARSGEWDDAVAMDPVSFNRVVVNQGDGWGAEVSNYFTVPVSGYYLIILSAGAKQGRRVDYRMYIDDSYEFDIYRQSLAHTDVDTIGRTGIFYLEVNQRLRMRSIGNTALYSSTTGYETSFGGMLLYSGTQTAANKEKAEEMFNKFKISDIVPEE